MSSLPVQGMWRAILESGGEVKATVQGPNIITTVGKEFLASFLSSASASASTFNCRYVALGTGGTAASLGDTALGGEVTRTTGTVSYVSGQMYVVTATFPSGTGTGSISEYGLLSSSALGTLLSRSVQNPLVKAANDSLTTVLQVTFN